MKYNEVERKLCLKVNDDVAFKQKKIKQKKIKQKKFRKKENNDSANLLHSGQMQIRIMFENVNK